MTTDQRERGKGCVVKGRGGHTAAQGTDYHPGISAETVGSKALWFGAVVLPPGRRTKAHIHPHHESAFYMLSGDAIELWTGDALQHREVAYPGDYLFIPPGIPHVAVNRGASPAVFIGARDEATAEESVVMCPAMDAKVP